MVIKPSTFTSNKQELLQILHAPISVGRDSPVWISIDQSINALLSGEGRRVVLVISSDGYEGGEPSIMNVKPRDLAARAREANVMIYALGFTDIQERTDGKPPKITPPDPGLRELADDTGGGYSEVRDTASLTTLFTRVAEELHRQYWLGFVPPLRDGKVHNIQVRATNKDLVVRADRPTSRRASRRAMSTIRNA